MSQHNTNYNYRYGESRQPVTRGLTSDTPAQRVINNYTTLLEEFRKLIPHNLIIHHAAQQLLKSYSHEGDTCVFIEAAILLAEQNEQLQKEVQRLVSQQPVRYVQLDGTVLVNKQLESLLEEKARGREPHE